VNVTWGVRTHSGSLTALAHISERAPEATGSTIASVSGIFYSDFHGGTVQYCDVM
jgi:hypothetical protein